MTRNNNTIAALAAKGAAQLAPEHDRWLSLPAAVCLTGLSRSTIYRKLDDDEKFPKPRKIGARRIAFSARELGEYMNSLPRAA